jgi:hypothetical protein
LTSGARPELGAASSSDKESSSARQASRLCSRARCSARVSYAALVNLVFADCVPMNFFGGVQNISPEAAAYIVDDYKHATQHTTQDFIEFVMTGDVWEGFGAGAISGAFGASYRSEKLDQKTPDPTDEFPAASGLKWYYDRQDKNAPLVEWNQS